MVYFPKIDKRYVNDTCRTRILNWNIITITNNIFYSNLYFLLLSYSLIIEQYYQHHQRKWVFIGNNHESTLSTTHHPSHIMLLLNKRVLTPPPNHCIYFLIIRCDSFYDVTRDLKSSKKGTSLGRGNKTTFGDKYGFPSPLHY